MVSIKQRINICIDRTFGNEPRILLLHEAVQVWERALKETDWVSARWALPAFASVLLDVVIRAPVGMMAVPG